MKQNTQLHPAIYRFGVVTALPKEFAAMRAMLDESKPYHVDDDPNEYVIGTIPAIDGNGLHHIVVTLLKKTGNNSAAATVSHLLRSFPSIQDVLMVGIAGGVPHPQDREKHVRLGDIVVSNEYGVVQFDNMKLENGKVVICDSSTSPSAALIGRINYLESERLSGKCPWEAHVLRAKCLEGAQLPSHNTDRLFSSVNQSEEISHPDDPNRIHGKPKVHYGKIGSSNTLLRDAKARDALRKELKIHAVEMEGSGIADGAWVTGKAYIIIRGISDYCDQKKNDTWQGYAAVVAAAYVRSLIESFPAKEDPRITEAKEKLHNSFDYFNKNEFETAACLCKEAAVLAKYAVEKQLECKAHLYAARALGEHIISSPMKMYTQKQITAQINQHINLSEELGANIADIALERALAARLEGKPDEVLKQAGIASINAKGDMLVAADALIARLQAYWQLGQLDKGIALGKEVENVKKQLCEEDARLALNATWLRTLCKAKKSSISDVEHFIQEVRNFTEQGLISHQRAVLILGQVVSELSSAGYAKETLIVSKYSFEIAVNNSNSQMATNIALHIAELYAYLGELKNAKLFIGNAKSWLEKIKSDKTGEAKASWATLHASILFGSGRVFHRLSSTSGIGINEAMELLHGASKSLNEAKSFAIEKRACLTGDVEIFLADVSWWLGRVTLDLGQPEMAADYFRNTRSEAAMAHPHFAQEICMSAWLGEAEALMLSGRVNDATNTVNSLIQDRRAPKNIKKKARAFNEYLERRVRPIIDWFKSTEAKTIYRESRKNGLRGAVAQQLEPLITWWKEWHEEKSGAESELLDFWGRGGFSRLAAAVRSKPFSAIAVDARSINEIRLWARIFCPIFDTVIIKWKGDLGSGIVFAPIHEKYGDNEEFGGHGYLVAAGDRLSKKDWCPALSWANPLPREVSVFLASEALPLLSEGRLIVLPAPLVGCTQSAIGWTDDLLVDNFLGGVGNVAKQPDYSKAEATKGHQKILDLAKISIPYIDNIRLSDLAKVLDETEEWVGPLRSFLMRSICSDDLKKENWAKIALIEGDIHDAFRIFQEQLTSLVQNRKQETWKVCEATGSFSAGSRGINQLGHEPITDLLRTIASTHPDLTHWIPYWRLETQGGYIDWTCRIDNPSKLPNEEAFIRGFKEPEIQSWLYPGTGGWRIPSAARRVSL